MSVSMNPFAPLPWQQGSWTQLVRARAQDQLAHAWLVSGPRGVGKKSLVGAWIAALLCERVDTAGQACGGCASCKMLLSGGHPDAHLLSLDGHLGLALNPTLQRKDGLTHCEPKPGSKRTEISVDVTRSLIDALSVTSHRQGCKIAVIVPAEELNRSSADALLKTIEEPTPNTFLILIAEQALSLSATLRSRCRGLRLGFPPAAAALEWLVTAAAQANPNADPETCTTALNAARGAPLLALQKLEAGAAARDQEWRAALDAMAQGTGDPLKLAAAIDEAVATEFLHACQVWLVERLRAGISETSGDAYASGRRLAELSSELHDAHRRLASNTRPQLVFEAMLIGWTRLLAVRRPRSSSAASGALAAELVR